MQWGTILRWVMIVAWFAHGLGTLANVVTAFGVNIGFPNKPPVLNILTSSPARYVVALVWLVVAAGYVAAAVGLDHRRDLVAPGGLGGRARCPSS